MPARKDGIEFRFLKTPIAVQKQGDRFALTLIQMQRGEKDASGRSRPIPIEGYEETRVMDFAIKPIGEYADMSVLPREMLDEKGWLKVDQKNLQTLLPRVFAGGDYVTGPATVVEAIADGYTAARSIEQVLDGIKPEPEPRKPSVPIKQIRLDYFQWAPRINPPELAIADRIQTMIEEVLTLSEAQAVAESLRCFSCGVCNRCGNCWVFYPDLAIHLLSCA